MGCLMSKKTIKLGRILGCKAITHFKNAVGNHVEILHFQQDILTLSHLIFHRKNPGHWVWLGLHQMRQALHIDFATFRQRWPRWLLWGGVRRLTCVLISQMTRQSCSRFKSFAAVSTQWTYMNLQLLLLNQLVTTCHIWKLHEVSKTCWTKANPKRGNQSPFSFLYLHVDDINGCRFQKWSKESDYCHYCLGFAINILLPLYTSSLKQLALMFNKPFGNEKHLANPVLGHLVFIPKSSL